MSRTRKTSKINQIDGTSERDEQPPLTKSDRNDEPATVTGDSSATVASEKATGDASSSRDGYPYPEDEYSQAAGYEPEVTKEAAQASKSKGDEEGERTKSGSAGGGGNGGRRKTKEKYEDPERRMPFLDHLEELRWTIIRSLLAISLTSVVCYFFSRQIIEILRYPGPKDMKLIFLSPTEGFMIYIKVSIFAGLIVALPYVAYQFWKFIVPGLLEKERRLVSPIVLYTVLCFLVGAAFAYFLIIPFGLRFLMSFQTDFLEANITIGKYLGFVVTLLLVFGVVFELPVLAYLLTHIGLLTPEFLRSKRRYGIVIIFIVAAILTPPDAFTQTMLAIPLMLLYEISIWVSASVRKKKIAREAKAGS